MEFKPIPGFPNYAISKEGVIKNLYRNSNLKPIVTSFGYRKQTIVDADGRRRSIGRHRLLCMTYKPIDQDITNLHVNHINGVPGDDRLENLEWCTAQENTNHAIAMGLNDFKRSPVSVLEKEDGTTTLYASIHECARALGFTVAAIRHRLNYGSDQVWPEGYRYRYGTETGPWPEVNRVRKGTRAKEVLLKDLKTGNVLVFDKLGDCLPYIGFKLSKVWMWADDPAQPVIPTLYLIKFMDDKAPFREVTDPLGDLDTTLEKYHLTIQWNDDEIYFYAGANLCARANGLLITTMNWRLKKMGRKVEQDGYRFCYYKDFTEEGKIWVRQRILGW